MGRSIRNDGGDTLFIAGRMIPAGEEVWFEDDQLPPELRAAPLAEAPGAAAGDQVALLLDLSIGALARLLPGVTDDELDRLEAGERKREKPRSGALAEIIAERLRRAEAATPGGLGEQAGQDAEAAGG